MDALTIGDVAAAVVALDAADAALIGSGEPDPFDAANVALGRARALQMAQDRTGAQEAAKRALSWARLLRDGHDSPRLLVHCLLEVADGEREGGDYRAARPLLDEALAVATDRLGHDASDTASVWNSLGMWHRYRGELDVAAAAYGRAQSIYERHGATADLASVLHNQSSVAHLRGQLELAEATIRQALTLRGTDMAKQTADFASLAAVLADQGRYDEATAIYGRTRVALNQLYGADSDELVYLTANEAGLAHRRRDLDEAATLYAAALAASERRLGPVHPQTGVILANSAALAVEVADRARGHELAHRAETILSGAVAAELPSLRLARELLAELHD